MSELRICTRCNQAKPLFEFSTNGKFGLHTSCRACQRDTAKRKRLENPELYKQRDAAKHQRHRASRLETMAAYSAANGEKRRAAAAKRYQEKAHELKEKAAAYRAENRAKVYSWNASRRAREKQATPSWADHSLISAFYEQAARLTAETGIVHHVDHVVPLRGKTVSGLHVQGNLQVLPAAENLRKSAKHV